MNRCITTPNNTPQQQHFIRPSVKKPLICSRKAARNQATAHQLSNTTLTIITSTTLCPLALAASANAGNDARNA
jgi:hypothetical protein